jgi:LmbE family N-acetylglucosaminyl deacetylase
VTLQRSLFLFAHQDDEYGAAPWILDELASGADVACLYLTDGGSRVAPAIRDDESRNVLRSLGVRSDRIVFLDGAGGRIADGALAARSLDGLAMVSAWIERNAWTPSRIYSPSYEGGHADHDAAHLIAAAVARRNDALGDAWHFSLYNGYRRTKPFFNVLRQLPSEAPSRGASLSASQRFALALLCRRYASQRRTWLGLFPGAFVERALLARESVIRFDLARLSARPHVGPLLYERIFGKRYEEFASEVEELVSLLHR